LEAKPKETPLATIKVKEMERKRKKKNLGPYQTMCLNKR
jgi:hypothetical protein